MPCDDHSPRMWVRVRDQSVLHLSLAPSSENYAQTVRLFINPGSPDAEVEEWTRDEVTPGPKRRTLDAGNSYELEVLLSFTTATATSVEVQAKILRPNGAVHGREFCELQSGQLGSPSVSSLCAIFTRPS